MKIVSRIFIAMLICVSLYQKSQAQITLSIGSQTVCNVGDSITVPVNVTGFTAVGTFSIKILYNPAVLTFGRTLNWNSSFNDVIQGNNSSTGTLGESWIFETGPVTIANGKLFDIKFAAKGGSSNVNFSANIGDNEVTDDAGTPYTITGLSGGTATQSSPTPLITGSLSYCTGSNTTLNAGSYASYLWSNSATTQSITVTAGTYSVTATDGNGCTGASVNAVVVQNNPNSFTQILNKCTGFSVTVGGHTYTTTGVYTDVLVNAKGCDSTVTTNLTIKNSSTGNVTQTECDSYSWYGTTYTSSTTASKVLTNAAGCDSVVTLNLAIKHSTTGADVRTACNSFTWINGVTYTSSNNTATKTLTNAAGCDSVVTLNLTIKNSSVGTDVRTACNSFTWIDGNTYTSNNNTATKILTNAAGCDSVLTLNLTIKNSTTTTINKSDCNPFTVNGQTYSTTGTYTQTLVNAAGCDSILTINYTFINGDETINATACNSYTYNGVTYTSSGTYTQPISGCVATATINVTLKQSTTGSQTVTACNNYTWNGVTYTSSATATITLTNAAGCDSVATLYLTINNSNAGSVTASTCDSYTWYGVTYTSSTTATKTLTNAAGCDSVATLNLTIKNANTGTVTASACNNYTWYGVTYTNSTTATKTLTNQAGCDSIVTLNLTIRKSNTESQTATACNSYTWNGTTYTSSTTDTKVLTNAAGCDSTVTLQLTINHPNTGTDVKSACGSYTWNGVTYTGSTAVTKTLTNAGGCDSVTTLYLNIKNANTGNATVSACGSYTWYGVTYTNSTTATKTLTNVQGCDSVVTLNLTIKNSNAGSETVSACDSYTWNGTTYTNSTTAIKTLTNAAGCDSVATLYLTIKKSTTATINKSDCNPYTVNGQTYSTTGTYTQTLVNAAGCDSILTINYTFISGDVTVNATECDSYTYNGVTYTSSDTYTQPISGCSATATINLTIKHSTTGSEIVSACNSYSWNGITYTSSTTATKTLTNAAGCDSVVTLNLTIRNSNTGTATVTACNSYTWYGVTYTSGTTASKVLTNTQGCDSTVTLHLTINNSNTGTATVAACDSYTWYGNTYTSSTTAIIVLTNAQGCDSTVTLNLTITHSNTSSATASACNSYTWYGVTYTSSTTATKTLTNAAGCDSVVTLNLTIRHSNTFTDVQTACNSFTWIDSNTYTSSNNTATKTLTNAVGCDSVVTLNLTIMNSNTGIDVNTACNSFTWIDGNTYTSSNNTATKTLTNAAGCDSVVTLNLSIKNSNTGIDTRSACNSFTWIDGNTYTSSNNTATKTLTNAAGCDSVVTLNLTIRNSNAGTDIKSACNNYTWIDGNTYTSSNNTATKTLTNAAGCDSVVTLNLTINNNSTGDTTVTACNSFTWNGVTHTSSGTSANVLTTAAGCDSTVTLHLTILNKATSNTTDTACGSYTWNGETYDSSGTFTYSSVSSGGCDSIATLVLKITPLPNPTITYVGNITICQGDSVKLASSDASAYLWSNNSTAPVINATAGGDYSVKVTDDNGCSKISSAISVTVNALPTPVITGNLVFCDGDTITLTASGGESYLWMPGSITTATARFDTANSVALTVTDTNNCSTTVSSALIENEPPVISISGNNTVCEGENITLTASGSGGGTIAYNWSTGDITASITQTPASDMSYTVTGTSNGCSASATHSITLVDCQTGIGEGNFNGTLSVYPNPTTGNVALTITMNYISNMLIKVTDVQGQIIFCESGLRYNGEFKANIDLSKIAKGVYFLNIITEREITVKRILVQ